MNDGSAFPFVMLGLLGLHDLGESGMRWAPTREERAREYAIMRAVGAKGSLLRQVQRAELAGVGLLAGFMASMVAASMGWALARYVFEFEWTVSL